MRLLNLTNLTKKFGALVAVDSVSFKVEAGRITSLIGPNGAGKTTIFNLISRIIQPDSGDIHFLGKEIKHLKTHQIVREGIARTWQNRMAFPELTVLEHLMIASDCHRDAELFGNIFRSSATVEKEERNTRRAGEIMEFLNLKSVQNEKASSLPFGTLSSLLIGMALMTKPKLIMLDEPVMGMSPVETKETMATVKKILKEMGISVLLIEHDMNVVMNDSDWIVVINFGRQIAEGTPEQIGKNQKVIDAYLGEEEE